MIESVRTWRLLHSMRAGSRRSPEDLARLQGRLLRATVAHAYERIPFYRRSWDEAGLDPGDVTGVEDIDRLPPITRITVREAAERNDLVARDVDPDRATGFHTSGSSGPPFRVPRTAVEQRLWRAGGLRIWLEHGYRWRDATAWISAEPGPTHPLQRLGISRTAWIPPALPIDDQIGRLLAAGPDVIAGTPTELRRICEALDGDGWTIKRPRIVFHEGEPLDPGTDRLIERTFGVSPVGFYGLSEVGYVAWQCERLEGFHVSAETCLVELIRDGRPARPGELGRIVVTDLRGRAMPLIRYDTGDLAVAGEAPCACGRSPGLIASIEGRARDAIILEDGRVLAQRAIVNHLSGALPPTRYRLHQETPGRFLLHLDRGTEEDGAVRLLRELFGDVEIHPVEGLPPAPGAPEKSQPVSSALPSAIVGGTGDGVAPSDPPRAVLGDDVVARSHREGHDRQRDVLPAPRGE
jgi:phenylacetate-CoA ligase